MFGVAMSEVLSCCIFDSSRTYGKDDEANELAGTRSWSSIADRVNSFDAVYPTSLAAASPRTHRLASDQQGVTPGVRIKVGDEPKSLDHSACMHRFFSSGVSGHLPS